MVALSCHLVSHWPGLPGSGLGTGDIIPVLTILCLSTGVYARCLPTLADARKGLSRFDDMKRSVGGAGRLIR